MLFTTTVYCFVLSGIFSDHHIIISSNLLPIFEIVALVKYHR